MDDLNKYKQMAVRLYQLYLEELLSGVEAGEFMDVRKIPPKYTYRHLNALLYHVDLLENGKEYYQKIYHLAMRHGELAARDKIARNGRIRAAFLVSSAAEWPAEKLYRMMDEDQRIENYIVVCPFSDRDPADAYYAFQKTYNFFAQNGYSVKQAYDYEANHVIPWEQNGGIPDIVIHFTPWYGSMLEEYQIESLPLSCINCYIPYGVYVADNLAKDYAVNYVYNNKFVNLLWRVYADTEINLQGYQRYNLLGGSNVRFSGYCKMDCFYEPEIYSEQEIRQLWSIPEHKNAGEMKRLIIAPHHSVMDTMIVSYSTFQHNLYFLLYLAKKYKDDISFIYKPHPNLRHKSVEAGVFNSLDEYDAYVEMWNRLPNARAVDEDDYLKLFATSDGMIMDSASFIAEYMYVNKPLLFLEKSTQAFNKLGERVMEAHYKADGTDYYGIEQFVQKVILQGDDTMKTKREEIFAQNLDYREKNHCSASAYIYNDIIKELF